MAAVQSAVASSVSSSTTSVHIEEEPQLTARTAPHDATRVPYVPRSDGILPGQVPPQPIMGNDSSAGSAAGNPTKGAPSVPPMNGVLYRSGPIDPHYSDTAQAKNPYTKVNNPVTNGRFSWVKTFANHVAHSQDTDNAGWKQNSPQQRTSYMRVDSTHAGGYAPESSGVHYNPQIAHTNRLGPVIGSDPYGSGVLNRDTFGAGQTAAGIGGNNYSPAPGSPDTNPVSPGDSGMPMWG